MTMMMMMVVVVMINFVWSLLFQKLNCLFLDLVWMFNNNNKKNAKKAWVT